MSPDDLTRVRHIVEAIDAAVSFVAGRRRADLETDQMLVFALARAIEVVGEAASRISQEGREELSSVPWNSIVGMRNRLVHAYHDIDHEILWTTVTEAAPPLAERLRPLLEVGRDTDARS